MPPLAESLHLVYLRWLLRVRGLYQEGHWLQVRPDNQVLVSQRSQVRTVLGEQRFFHVIFWCAKLIIDLQRYCWSSWILLRKAGYYSYPPFMNLIRAIAHHDHVYPLSA